MRSQGGVAGGRTGPPVFDLDALRPSRSAVIPASSWPVAIERLHLDVVTRATVSLVVFPPGWAREETGAYGCAEEFVVLDGSLAVSGLDFVAGEWVHLPAGWVRSRSASRAGARALAFFSGVPAWLPGDPAGPPVAGFAHGRPHGILRGRSPGVQGMVEVETDRPTTVSVTRDVLSLGDHTWALVPPGEPVPEQLAGPWLVRRWA